MHIESEILLGKSMNYDKQGSMTIPGHRNFTHFYISCIIMKFLSCSRSFFLPLRYSNR